MASKALFLLLSLLATSNALSVPTKRAAANKVTDGGFENTPSSCQSEQNVECGAWTLTGIARIEDGSVAPSGQVYVSFFNQKPHDRGGTISQEVDGLTTGETYTLSYEYQKYFNYKPAACKFVVTLGSQTVDSVSLPADEVGTSNPGFVRRRKSFTPMQSSGTLTLQVACPYASGRYEVDLDNVSIVGPA